MRTLLLVVFAMVSLASTTLAEAPSGALAPKPLFRDPVYDGAADPVVVWNPQVQKWWMFYTNRRANAPELRGETWVHGTPIGIAESGDHGATWKYLGQAEFKLPADLPPEVSLWAPEIVETSAGQWRMYLTIVPGVFADWGHPRAIVEFQSSDLKHWAEPQPLKLSSDRCIDAGMLRMPTGEWRLWYNDERDRKAIYLATSPNLKEWTQRGKVLGDRACEAPKAFHWRDHYWLVVDAWEGLGVYRSPDADQWERQPTNLLAEPGEGADDQVKGGHCDVVINPHADRAWIFYFTHPGRRGPDANKDATEQRRSSIQVAELRIDAKGWLTCDRNAPTQVDLGRE